MNTSQLQQAPLVRAIGNWFNKPYVKLGTPMRMFTVRTLPGELHNVRISALTFQSLKLQSSKQFLLG